MARTRSVGTNLRRAYGVRLLYEPGVRRAALVLVLGLVLLVRAVQFAGLTGQPQWGYDFGAYWLAGRHVLAGEPIYAAAQLAGPYSPQQPFLYLYPPFLAVVATPFGVLADDHRAAAWAWAALGAIVAVVVALALARSEGLARGRGRWIVVGVAFAFPPLVGELVMGNVHLLLLGLLAGAWLAVRRGDHGSQLAAGAAVGAAALVKVFPALVVLWFVLTGRRRAAAAAVVSAAVLALLTLPVTGLQPWIDYPRVLANLGPPVDTRDTLAPAVWLAGLVGPGPARALVAVAALGIVSWSARRHSPAIGFAVVVLVSVLAAPALYHHYLAIALLPLLLGWANGARRPWLVAGYLAMFGGTQAALGDAAWIVNRALPTAGALLLLVGLLATPPAGTRTARAGGPVAPRATG